MRNATRRFEFLASALTAALLAGCGGSANSLGSAPKDAGGGQQGPDANAGDGLAGSVGTGGMLGVGGVVGTGGATSAGGAAGTGGVTAMGGASGTGGAMSAGGVTGTGGAIAMGGASGTGGATSAGGVTGTGGKMGGATGAGGSSGASGGGGSGGAVDAGGGDAGRASTYSGCTFVGGIDRAVVAKFDPQAGICATLVLSNPNNAPDAGFGMTITPRWGVEGTYLWPSTTDACSMRFGPAGAVHATSASGSASVNFSAATPSPTLDVDAILYFPATDAGPAQTVELKAQGVDIRPGC